MNEDKHKNKQLGKEYNNRISRSEMMIGILINEKEVKEIEYLIKREMDEILYDLKDDRIDQLVKRAMDERYMVLFTLFRRVAPPNECLKYLKRKKGVKNRLQ